MVAETFLGPPTFLLHPTVCGMGLNISRPPGTYPWSPSFRMGFLLPGWLGRAVCVRLG